MVVSTRLLGPSGVSLQLQSSSSTATRSSAHASRLCTTRLKTGRSLACTPVAVLQRNRKDVQQPPIPSKSPGVPALRPTPVHTQPSQQHLEVADHLNQLYQRQILPHDVDQSSQLLASGSGQSSVPEPATDGKHVWYFAYGANMNFFTLARRDVKVVSRDPAVLRDPEVRMMFKHRGGYATLGHLTPLEQPRYPPFGAQRVHGVLYRLSTDDFKRLQKREGGYSLEEMEVESYSGRVVKAMVFVSTPLASLPQEVVPTEKYMSLLREGARDNYLDPLYQAWVSSIETVPSVGLGPEYYNTPSKYVAYSFVFISACIAAAFFFQQ